MNLASRARTTVWVATVIASAALFGGCGLPAGELTITRQQQDSLTTERPRLGPECTDTLSCCPEAYISCTGNPDEQIYCECSLWACDTTSGGAERCWRSLPRPAGMATAECTWTELSYTCEAPIASTQIPEGSSSWTCEADPERQTLRCEALFPANPLDLPSGATDYVCEPDNELERLVCIGTEPVANEQDSSCPYELESCNLSNSAINVPGQTGSPTIYSGGSGGGSAVGVGGTAPPSSSTDGATKPITE